jgi:hypothetical protein
MHWNRCIICRLATRSAPAPADFPHSLSRRLAADGLDLRGCDITFEVAGTCPRLDGAAKMGQTPLCCPAVFHNGRLQTGTPLSGEQPEDPPPSCWRPTLCLGSSSLKSLSAATSARRPNALIHRNVTSVPPSPARQQAPRPNPPPPPAPGPVRSVCN